MLQLVLVVGGEMQDWAFSATYKDAMNPATLYSYFHADSVVGLKLNTSNVFVLGKATATTAQADALKLVLYLLNSLW